MTAKDYLEQIKRKDTIINNMIREKEYLYSRALCVQGIRYDRDRVQTSVRPDQMGDMLARVDQKEEEINRKIDELTDFRLKAIGMINSLGDDRYVSILYKRYVNYETWEKIADDLGYTDRHALRLHGEALDEFSKKYSEELERCQ